ncbi:hypothetical protein Taro_021171 [Colocasia esculenta]|uniref:Uncharacterized protein n=1 Tax=Colocasia esculenta TaxID=4460 RepID=A0A843V1P8_COLES|nr:hypothetical protein [Colocasia esculenta]
MGHALLVGGTDTSCRHWSPTSPFPVPHSSEPRPGSLEETYDRTMMDRYAEGTPQLDLDMEAWVDAAGGPRKGRV